MTHCCLSGILFMTHCRFLGGFLWRILYLTHLIYHAYWIFLCNMLYMCSVFYMIFVQFLGCAKCLNNPFFTICRIAHTKKPHRANFLRSLTVTLEQGISLKYIHRWGTSRTSPYARFNKTSQPYTSHVYP